jgi:DNA-binding MurR/RpiR family transcriptional regulator
MSQAFRLDTNWASSMIASMADAHAWATIATALHELQGELPPSERRVARALLGGYPVAGIGTLAELAERARVSSPTVLRLVNRLGLATFGDFQRALLAEVEERLATTASAMAVEPAAPDAHVITTLLHEAAANISADARALVPEEVDEVVDLIATRSRHVVMMGGWLTQTVADYLYAQLRTMRPRCRSVGWAVSSGCSELADLGRRDTLVVFDCRPYEAATEQLCAWARRRGVRGPRAPRRGPAGAPRAGDPRPRRRCRDARAPPSSRLRRPRGRTKPPPRPLLPSPCRRTARRWAAPPWARPNATGTMG